MEDVIKEKVSFPHVCGFCGDVGISKCGRCLAMYYCCKEHQRQHWPVHKSTCKKSSTSIPVPTSINEPTSSNVTFSPPDNRKININEQLNIISIQDSPSNLNVTKNRSPSNLNVSKNRSPSNLNVSKNRSSGNLNVTKNRSPSNRNVIEQQNTTLTLHDACSKLIRDLNSVGICVIDDFMGSYYGNLILEEVQNLYKKGIFQKGKLLFSRPGVNEEDIRSDVNTWVTSEEPECTNIGHLMRKIDSLIGASNKEPNNGLLAEHKLQNRTRIMIACYPGNGTHYDRHVDNPNKDGRCLTCVYYLNHNWEQAHGGVLRAYPCFSSKYHDIEPIFDRLVIFWSNRRVPHEVLPAFVTRFAVTVWYFDILERAAAHKKLGLDAKQAKNP